MMKSQAHTVPSLSGTFGIRTRQTHNPKMPKEPFSPSLSEADTLQHCSKIESFELITTKSRAYNKVHISERGRCGYQRRILASPFSPRGHERSPKSAPQTCTNRYKPFWKKENFTENFSIQK